MPSRKSPLEGIEKRGVVVYGWTPPEGSPVKVTPGLPSPASKSAEAGDTKRDQELDNDLAKRASDATRDRLK